MSMFLRRQAAEPIPMIALGIPGDATTVLLMSAMTIHGLQAGPMFIKNNPLLANLIFASLSGSTENGVRGVNIKIYKML